MPQVFDNLFCFYFSIELIIRAVVAQPEPGLVMTESMAINGLCAPPLGIAHSCLNIKVI